MHALHRTLALGFLALAPQAATAGEHFLDDFDQAVALAKGEGKDLFVDFTGSDWCGWCIKLDKEVFSHDEFLTAAQEHFVLVALDFPRKEEAKARVPNPERNAELRDKYEVSGFPTCLLMTAGGDVYGQMGYQEGGPEKFVGDLEAFRAKDRKVLLDAIALVKEFEAAEGAARVAVWERVVTLLETLERDSAVAARLAGPVRSALETDPDNAAGRKLRAVKALVLTGQADDEVLDAAAALDPKNKNGLLEQVLFAHLDRGFADEEQVREFSREVAELDAMGPIKDREVAFWLYAVVADMNDRHLGDPVTARRFAKKAKEIGSEREDIIERLDEILGS